MSVTIEFSAAGRSARKQLELFDRPLVQATLPAFEPELSIAERFERFHAANPHVYTTLVAMARRLKRHGCHRVGMKMLFERLRWEWFEQTAGDTYKLNNNYTAYYARRIMRRERDLAGFFETRERTGKSTQ